MYRHTISWIVVRVLEIAWKQRPTLVHLVEESVFETMGPKLVLNIKLVGIYGGAVCDDQ